MNPGPTMRNVPLIMRDQVVIAADVYLPPSDDRHPAVLLYEPYQKDVWRGVVDARYYEYFANAGYAFVTADFRGTGASQGAKSDAFETQESDDVYDLVLPKHGSG